MRFRNRTASVFSVRAERKGGNVWFAAVRSEIRRRYGVVCIEMHSEGRVLPPVLFRVFVAESMACGWMLRLRAA